MDLEGLAVVRRQARMVKIELWMISRGPQWDRRWRHSRPLSSRIYASLKSLRYATLPSCSFPSLLNSFLPSFSFLFSLMRSSPLVTWRSPALTLVVTLRASSVLYFSLLRATWWTSPDFPTSAHKLVLCEHKKISYVRVRPRVLSASWRTLLSTQLIPFSEFTRKC